MKKTFIIIGFILAAFGLGLLLGGNGTRPVTQTQIHDHAATDQKTRIWTCSMHPQIRMNHPGKCPICGMDLIPVKSEGSSEQLGDRTLRLSPLAMKLAEVETAPVTRKYVTAQIRMVGKIAYDETRLAYITAWVPGRIDRLYVDYTGITVQKGDHMVYLYSPELLTAQEELLQAIRSENELKQSGMKIMRETAAQTVEASREKLRLWGLTESQIKQIERRGKSSDHVTIYAPMGGIVIQKNVQEGAYINTGTRLYTIADLSRLWILLDAYESDLMWLRYGQEVRVETEAYPGETFRGTISFIDPVLDARTRTVKVRVNVSNENGRLKPDMFVHTTVFARVAGDGKVMDENLAGKWICPMHPDVIKEKAGSCDICEMPLVRTETLGYASVDQAAKSEPPLVIPDSAPLITGKRAVVYVADPAREGVFEGREVTLGPRAGNYYLVNQGLKQGERVVVNGNFKIDSALQIQAKKSMMNPDGGGPMPGHGSHGGMAMPGEKTALKDHTGHEMSAQGMKKAGAPKAPPEFQKQIDAVLAVYLKMEEALSTDDAAAAKKLGKAFLTAVDGVDMKLLTGEAHMAWMKGLKDLTAQAGVMGNTSDINRQRKAFALLSESMASVIRTFGTGGKEMVMQFHCPMAFGGRGADWLQNKKNVQNPYFGKTMSKCGEITETLVEPKK